MTETKCLICNSRSAPNRPNPKTSNILTNQLSAIFLLRNVFELPSWIIQKYLISSGGCQNPSQWISVCTECDSLVRKTRTFYDQFVEADRNFRRTKYELVRKMRESSAPGFSNCGSISEECRQFVQLHDYAEPPKNLFSEGDHLARHLLGVGVDFNVPSFNLKTEVVESTEENAMEVANLPEFDPQHHTYMDLGCSQVLPFTPEGHDYDDSEGEDGGGSDYYDEDDNDDDDYACLPPGPKCRKLEAKAKSENSTNNDSEPRSDEITAAEASNLIQFLTTSQGKRMVHYDGNNFYQRYHKTTGSGMTYFYCKYRRDDCMARISLRNYNDEDGTYTGFMPNLEPHDHSAAQIGPRNTKSVVLYEVHSLAKEIVKDNVNAPVSQVLQMVLDSFMGDPDVTEELSKKNAHRNLRRVIHKTKLKLGWKPDGTGRRRFIATNMKGGESNVGGTMEQAPVQEEDESQAEVKNDLIPSLKDIDMQELTFEQASTLIQFLTTSHGKRMISYDGHNFYHGGHKSTSTGFTHFNCKWRREGCLARISLRNFNDVDATYTGFVSNFEPHSDHSAAAQNGGDKTKHGIWYEVNLLAKEIVKDNVNAPVGQVFQMIEDSFMADPEVTEELSKANVQRNLKKVIRTMKRKLGWKPDPKVRAKRIRTRRRPRVAKENSNENDHPPIPQLLGHTVE